MSERTVLEIPATPTPRPEGTGNAYPLRVAAYCRVSTGGEEQLSSYKSQIEYYTTTIMENPGWQLAGVFADEGLTGTNTKNRKEFNRMIRMCERGKIDLILTKSVSRFSRNTLDCIKYVRKLKALGVGVIFEKENIRTLEDNDEMILTVMGSLAQAESESLSKNVRMGFHQSFKEGNVPFHDILGYRRGSDGTPEILPEEAEVVRRIFDRYLAGNSVGQIVKDLESDQIPTTKGGSKWSPATVRNILQNERYIGDALLQKSYIEDVLTKKSRKNTGQYPQYYVQNNHPAIIGREIFDKVQIEIARRGSMRRKIPSRTARTEQSKYSGKYALTEILVCGECGTPYRRVTWTHQGSKRIVWRCVNRLEHGKRYCKRSITLDEQALHETIRGAVNQVISKKLLLEALLDAANAAGVTELKDDLAVLMETDPPELTEYDDRFSRLLLRVIRTGENTLSIVFKDGTEVVGSV